MELLVRGQHVITDSRLAFAPGVRNVDKLVLDSKAFLAEAFIHCAMGQDVDTAIVGGRVVMEHRRMRTLEVRKAARSIPPRQRRHAETLQRLKPYYQDWYNAWRTPKDVKPFYVLNSRA